MSKAYVNNNNNNNTSSSPSSSSNKNNKKRKLAEHLSTRFDESLESFLKRANPLWNKMVKKTTKCFNKTKTYWYY